MSGLDKAKGFAARTNYLHSFEPRGCPSSPINQTSQLFKRFCKKPAEQDKVRSMPHIKFLVTKFAYRFCNINPC